mmetsp:Transcript_103612/g.186941  ORF Transcript_103612/g.186941 Transcript_103612/m.186941 type:complete len:109 (-) Transcript_103612:1316-1642(-)
MSVAQLSKKARSCETATTIPSLCTASAPHCFRRCCCSHKTPCKSKWFVGSSSSRTSGRAPKAWASATRIRQPPDIVAMGFRIMSSSKFNLIRISLALSSASSERISSS